MNIMKIGINIFIPGLLLFLAFSTLIGYLAEDIRDYYNYKWAALALLFAGYMVQFYKKSLGLLLVIVSIVIWFML